MSEENKKPDEKPEDAPAKPGLVARLKSSKLYGLKYFILHVLLVLGLLGFFAWQILNYYVLSTESNIRNAIKTNHMIIYDLKLQEYLKSFPVLEHEEEEEDTSEEEHHDDTAVPEQTPEIAVMLTGIGKDPAYTSEVIKLPANFIFSFSPYGNKPFEVSMTKAKEGAVTAADVGYSPEKGGKFDIGAKNTEFRNLNNIAAGISKIYGPAAVFIPYPLNTPLIESINQLADKLQPQQVLIILPGKVDTQKENIAFADIYIRQDSTPDLITSELARAEQLAKSNGYALVVIEPQANIATTLKNWTVGLKDRGVNLITAVKN